MIGIIEYCAGNIRSVSNALKNLNVKHFISDKINELENAEKLIFPGVGEARSAMRALENVGLVEWLKNTKAPFLGICLGMQLLLEKTTERNTNTLGVISGINNKFDSELSHLKVPHMGWNKVKHKKNNLLFDKINSGEYFYFVHSYYASISTSTIGITEYGVEFTSALNTKNYYGVQFHPEKSGKAGLQLLNNFIELC